MTRAKGSSKILNDTAVSVLKVVFQNTQFRGNFGWFRLWGDLVLYPVLYATPFLTMANKKRQVNLFAFLTFVHFLSILTHVRMLSHSINRSVETLKAGFYNL